MAPTATAPAAEPSTAAAGSTYQEIEIGLIDLSGLNPRTHFDPAEDAELQASVKADGVIEPIVLRPHPAKAGRFQIVAGERRYRAAKAVGLAKLPAMVRNVDDKKLFDLALTENIQRKSMHPIDTANAFQRRLQMDKTATAQSLADTLGLSKRYVVDMLRLKDLGKRSALGLETGEITVSHAIVLAKLPEATQNKALDENYERVFDFGAEKHRNVLASVDALKQWVANNHRLDLKSPDAQEEFPELVADVAKAEAAGATITMLSDDWSLPYGTKASDADPLFKGKWDEVKKTDKGAQRGVISYGRRKGKLIWYRLKPEPKAAPATRTTSTPSPAAKAADDRRRKRDEADNKRRQAAAARRSLVVGRAIVQLVEKTATLTGKALLLLLADDAVQNTLTLEEAKTIAADVKVPAEALCGNSRKLLEKLTEKQLVTVILAAVVSSRASYGNGHKELKPIGIDISVIDKAVEKEQAAKAKTEATTKPAAAKTAKKAKKR